MGVLNIRTGLTIKVQYFVPAKGYIFDTLVIKVIEKNRANTDDLGNFFFIRKVWTLF